MAAPPVTERHLPHFHRRQPIKESVRVATTANITLSGTQTIDGIAVVAEDRVLVKDQSSASGNGIYRCQAGAWVRDYDQSTDDPAFGFLVFVRQGTANAQTLWRNTNTSAPTIGSSSIAFASIGGAASSVSITDAGAYFTATDVEAALQELAKKDIGYTAHGNTGSTETFDALTGWHSATLNANCTFTFTGATSGLVAAMVLELAQDGTGSRTVTWPGSVVWPGGVAPTLSTAAGAVDILTFFSRDGGTTWYGFPTGGSGGGSALTIKDEGSSLATAATSIDFVGAGVTASGATAAKTVTISGAPTGTAGGDLSGTYPNPSVVDDSHNHTSATLPSAGRVLLADGHATPFTFNDLLQLDDGSDFMYAD